MLYHIDHDGPYMIGHPEALHRDLILKGQIIVEACAWALLGEPKADWGGKKKEIPLATSDVIGWCPEPLL